LVTEATLTTAAAANLFTKMNGAWALGLGVPNRLGAPSFVRWAGRGSAMVPVARSSAVIFA